MEKSPSYKEVSCRIYRQLVEEQWIMKLKTKLPQGCNIKLDTVTIHSKESVSEHFIILTLPSEYPTS